MKIRGFEIAKGWENQDIDLPKRSTTHAAGYDITAATDIIVPTFQLGSKPTIIPTGVKAYFPPDECLLILNRSSGPKNHIVMANGIGLIDADYYNNPDNDGHICILIYNTNDTELHIKKGDRIAQAVFQKFLKTDDDLTSTEKRQGGLGSTNKT